MSKKEILNNDLHAPVHIPNVKKIEAEFDQDSQQDSVYIKFQQSPSPIDQQMDNSYIQDEEFSDVAVKNMPKIQGQSHQWETSEKDIQKIENRPGYNYKDLFRELCKNKENCMNGRKIMLSDQATEQLMNYNFLAQEDYYQMSEEQINDLQKDFIIKEMSQMDNSLNENIDIMDNTMPSDIHKQETIGEVEIKKDRKPRVSLLPQTTEMFEPKYSKEQSQEINKFIDILNKSPEARQNSDIMYLMPFLKSIQFFQDQNIQGKDLQDACELLNHECYQNGETIYSYGDQCDKMFIILEGKVEFSLDMNENRLSSSEVEELSRDVSKKDLANQFQKFKNQVGLGGATDPFTLNIRKAMTVKRAARKFFRNNTDSMRFKLGGLATNKDDKQKKNIIQKSGTLRVSPFERNTPSGKNNLLGQDSRQSQFQDIKEEGAEEIENSASSLDRAQSPRGPDFDATPVRGSKNKKPQLKHKGMNYTADANNIQALKLQEQSSSLYQRNPATKISKNWKKVQQYVLKNFIRNPQIGGGSFPRVVEVDSNVSESGHVQDPGSSGAFNTSMMVKSPDTPAWTKEMQPTSALGKIEEGGEFIDPARYINRFLTLEKSKTFGKNFITLGTEDKLYKAKCDAYSASPTVHLITFSMKSYDKILNRIQYKQKQQELQFLRDVYQLSTMSKRVLGRIRQSCTTQHFKRKDVIYKEGQESKYIYIVKDGNFSVSRTLMMPKLQEHQYEQKLLKSKTNIHKRFCSNFQKQKGLKKDYEIFLILAEEGMMLGDGEALTQVESDVKSAPASTAQSMHQSPVKQQTMAPGLHGLQIQKEMSLKEPVAKAGAPYIHTVVCHSISASALRISREEYLKIQQMSDEAFRVLKKMSQEQLKMFQNLFVKKISDTQILKEDGPRQPSKNGRVAKKSNTQIICDQLMREMMWQHPDKNKPKTNEVIQKYAIQKQIDYQQNQGLPNDVSRITSKGHSTFQMKTKDFEELRNNEWVKMVQNIKPQAPYQDKSKNLIQDYANSLRNLKLIEREKQHGQSSRDVSHVSNMSPVHFRSNTVRNQQNFSQKKTMNFTVDINSQKSLVHQSTNAQSISFTADRSKLNLVGSNQRQEMNFTSQQTPLNKAMGSEIKNFTRTPLSGDIQNNSNNRPKTGIGSGPRLLMNPHQYQTKPGFMLASSGMKSVKIIDNEQFDGPNTNLIHQLQNQGLPENMNSKSSIGKVDYNEQYQTKGFFTRPRTSHQVNSVQTRSGSANQSFTNIMRTQGNERDLDIFTANQQDIQITLNNASHRQQVLSQRHKKRLQSANNNARRTRNGDTYTKQAFLFTKR